MQELFYLYAIVRPEKRSVNSGYGIHAIETTDKVQRDLSLRFANMAEDWQGAVQLPFTPTYTPEDSEIFVVRDFVLADQLKKAATNRNQFSDFKKDDLQKQGKVLKGILGIRKKVGSDEATYYFQVTDRRNILDKTKLYALIFLNNQYSDLKEHALTISDHLSAIIQPDMSLHFRSFRDVSQFLDLDPIFKEATDGDIRKILNSEKVANSRSEIEKVIELSDVITRKRFSIIEIEGTLDKASVHVQKIVSNARLFGIEIALKGKIPDQKIVFPTDKETLKRFVKFLCQDYYESILTGDKCVSNSHRKLP